MKYIKRTDEFFNPFKKDKIDFSDDIKKLSSMYNYSDREISFYIVLNACKFEPDVMTMESFIEYIEKYGIKNIRISYDFDSTKFIYSLFNKILSFDKPTQAGIIENILLLILDEYSIIEYPNRFNISLDTLIPFNTFIEILKYINNY